MVRKVVTPARISVRTLVLCACSWNSFSSMTGSPRRFMRHSCPAEKSKAQAAGERALFFGPEKSRG
ncbi:hypothetical protein FQZ97_721170 [compost metagenome]